METSVDKVDKVNLKYNSLKMIINLKCLKNIILSKLGRPELKLEILGISKHIEWV